MGEETWQCGVDYGNYVFAYDLIGTIQKIWPYMREAHDTYIHKGRLNLALLDFDIGVAHMGGYGFCIRALYPPLSF